MSRATHEPASYGRWLREQEGKPSAGQLMAQSALAVAVRWRPYDVGSQAHGLRMDLDGDESSLTARIFVTEDGAWVGFLSGWHYAGRPGWSRPVRPVSMPHRRVVHVVTATTTPDRHPDHRDAVGWVRREALAALDAWLDAHPDHPAALRR